MEAEKVVVIEVVETVVTERQEARGRGYEGGAQKSEAERKEKVRKR